MKSKAYLKGCQIKRSFRKRAFDVLFSLAALIFLSPLFLVISAIIKATSKGDIFYRQQRIGRGGAPFTCYKFRTMYPNADQKLNDLLRKNASFKSEWEATYKLKNDPRITPIGKFLRRTSLDELPQFWNVLKGDLSIVGPRPVVEEEIEKHIKHKAAYILSVKPGITGLWQVSGRNNTSYRLRVRLDEKYVHKQSLRMDMGLILRTLPAMISSRGAY